MSESRHLVAVRWRDAHGSALAEFAEHEIPHRAFIWTTYGLLMRDDKEGISIASEVSEGSYRGVTFVPREMIIEVVDLGVPRRPRRRKSPSAQAPAATGAATPAAAPAATPASAPAPPPAPPASGSPGTGST